jgi:hypothetical protein
VDVERYLDGLAAVLGASETLSESHLRRVYAIFAVLNVPPEPRLRFLKRLSRSSRGKRITLPRWEDDRWRFSFAKDALTLAREGGGQVHERIERLQSALGLTGEELEVLWLWIRWEDRICLQIREGNLRVSFAIDPGGLFAHVATSVPLTALFLTGTRCAFAAAGIPRGPTRLHKNRLLIALTSSTAGVAAARRFTKAAQPGNRRLPAEEPRAEELDRANAQLTKAVDRYLDMVSSDAVMPATERRISLPVRAVLERLHEQDRLLERSERRQEKPEAQERRRARGLVQKLGEFANADINRSGEAAVYWEHELLRLAPNFYPRASLRASLNELRREIDAILRRIALSDSWSGSDAFLKLWSNPGWNPPRRDRSGFDTFAEHDMASDRTGIASTVEPISIHLQWDWSGDEVERQRVPAGPRDSLLLALDDAIALLGRDLRVRLCPVCRLLFVPSKRQLYWPDGCKQKANEFLRDKEQRNRRRRERYGSSPLATRRA